MKFAPGTGPKRIVVSAVVYLVFFLSSCLWFLPASAHEELPIRDRMRVEGSTLFFTTDDFIGVEGAKAEISYGDENLFGDLIMNNPQVDTVVVGGGGGSSYAAYGIARKIIEFGLSTVANGRCHSACTTIFLAGMQRSLGKGASLCFHRGSVSAKSYQETYNEVKDEEGWHNVFQLTERAFDRGQLIARDHIEFMIDRGVNVRFALRTLVYANNDMWCPYRDELVQFGVIAH